MRHVLLLFACLASVQVRAQVGTITGVAAGTASTCALFEGGNVKCWGKAENGRLGYGNLESIGDDEAGGAGGFVNLGVTEALPPEPLRASSVAIGTGHTCALLAGEAEGKVKCWGFGGNGATGYGNIESIGDNETPADVEFIDVGGQVTQLSAGLDHTCALLESKDVVCWGLGMDGRLGYGNQENVGDDELPSTVGPVNLGGKKVASVAAGGYHTCVLFEDGEVRCWGRGAEGQLGYGNTDSIGDNEEPTTGEVFLGGAKATQITAGERHTCAVVEDGSVFCWGLGANGQLGYGNLDNVGISVATTPGLMGPINMGGTVQEIHAGSMHTCAVMEDGIKCFGQNTNGELGRGTVATMGGTPASVPAAFLTISLTNLPGLDVASMASGASHNCAVMTDGSLNCWGVGDDGRLGYGNEDNVGDDETPMGLAVALPLCGLGDCAKGTCADEACTCTPGFEGMYCEDNVDACTAGSCANGGACIDGIEPGAFTCDCAGTGFKGDDCQRAGTACTGANICENGGLCVADADDADVSTCDCTGTGFTGPTCSVNIDECASNPCQNGGTCTSSANGFTCDCAGTGFTGSTCTFRSNSCDIDSCLNGGNCIDGINSFTCECASGFEGPSCAINIDDCADNPCQGGTCIDGINSYTCSCSSGNLRGRECLDSNSVRSGAADEIVRKKVPLWFFILLGAIILLCFLGGCFIQRRRSSVKEQSHPVIMQSKENEVPPITPHSPMHIPTSTRNSTRNSIRNALTGSNNSGRPTVHPMHGGNRIPDPHYFPEG